MGVKHGIWRIPRLKNLGVCQQFWESRCPDTLILYTAHRTEWLTDQLEHSSVCFFFILNQSYGSYSTLVGSVERKQLASLGGEHSNQ